MHLRRRLTPRRFIDKSCASCHQQPGADSRAPNREALQQFSPEIDCHVAHDRPDDAAGLRAERGGEKGRRRVARRARRRIADADSPTSARCTTAAPAMSDPTKGTNWNGWGGTVTNTRYVPADKGGITAPLVPRLKLKWAFGFPGVIAARAQPVVVGRTAVRVERERRRLRAEPEDRLHLLGVSRDSRASARPSRSDSTRPSAGANGWARLLRRRRRERVRRGRDDRQADLDEAHRRASGRAAPPDRPRTTTAASTCR